MFEGQVTMHGLGWEPWVRTLRPDEFPAISRDLWEIEDADAVSLFRRVARHGGDPDEEAAIAVDYLRRRRAFASGLAAAGRGAVYLIG